jgi:hypothetical protein
MGIYFIYDFKNHMGHQMKGGEMKDNEARVNKHPLKPLLQL